MHDVDESHTEFSAVFECNALRGFLEGAASVYQMILFCYVECTLASAVMLHEASNAFQFFPRVVRKTDSHGNAGGILANGAGILPASWQGYIFVFDDAYRRDGLGLLSG